MLAALGPVFREVVTTPCRVRVFTRLPSTELTTVFITPEYVICRLRTTAHGTVLLVAAHLASKLRTSAATQRSAAGDLAEVVRRYERRHRTEMSLVIGDLNMNPFDPGMVEVQGLHAVSSRLVATGVGNRTVNEVNYRMFFNPMWSHMGDGWRRPAGTYYRRTTDVDCIYFHTLDQVLVRPPLAHLIGPRSIRVLRRAGQQRFASPRDIPRKATVSDHLPVHVDLAL